jgi:1,4-alpha-glucan branching enzyme
MLQEVQATLRLYNPGARKVFIAGTFNDWHTDVTPLTNVGNGEWVLSLMLKPGVYEARFVADGQWQDDPQATERVKNPHGGWNAILRVESHAIRLPAGSLRSSSQPRAPSRPLT